MIQRQCLGICKMMQCWIWSKTSHFTRLDSSNSFKIGLNLSRICFYERWNNWLKSIVWCVLTPGLIIPHFQINNRVGNVKRLSPVFFIKEANFNISILSFFLKDGDDPPPPSSPSPPILMFWWPLGPQPNLMLKGLCHMLKTFNISKILAP